jgi:cyclic beta-1,2-glucan synthetase
MRRSLVPASVMLLLLGGWFALPGSALFWTALALLVPSAWLFTDLVSGLARGRRRGVLEGTLHQAAEHVGRWVLQIVFLVSDAATALHAIGITLLRMGQGRRLLEWTSAAHVGGRLAAGSMRGGQWRETWPSPVFAAVLLPAFAFVPRGFAAAAPVLCMWFAAPEIACWSGRSRTRRPLALDADARLFLRRVARRTWLFFETYVRPQDNWLPPDNHQEEPVEATAHRTSPTNIGMMALSALCAWRLGHISPDELRTRMGAMFASLDRLERWQGHFLNWYDTTSLASLEPRYVSTVDSGNLAVSLVVLAEGCRTAAMSPAFQVSRWDGLEDCLALLSEALTDGGYDARLIAGFSKRLAEMHIGKADPLRWPEIVDFGTEQIAALREDLARSIEQAPAASTGSVKELRNWIERSDHHLAVCRRDLDAYLPWLRTLAAAPAECRAMAERLAECLSPALPLNACARRADVRHGARMACRTDHVRAIRAGPLAQT